MNIAFIFTTHIKPFLPILIALLAFYLGKSAYFRQKEYELITKRYLEEGLDKISANVDSSLSAFRHNWTHCLAVIKSFRDLGKDMPRDLYMEGLISPNPSDFELWRDYRLKDIVGNDIFNCVHQLLDAFIKESYSFFKNDFCNGIRVTLEGGEELEVTATREELTEFFTEKIIEFNQRSEKFYILLGELQNISNLLQTQRFSFKNLQKVKDHEVVSNAVKKLHLTFEECRKEETPTNN